MSRLAHRVRLAAAGIANGGGSTPPANGTTRHGFHPARRNDPPTIYDAYTDLNQYQSLGNQAMMDYVEDEFRGYLTANGETAPNPLQRMGSVYVGAGVASYNGYAQHVMSRFGGLNYSMNETETAWDNPSQANIDRIRGLVASTPPDAYVVLTFINEPGAQHSTGGAYPQRFAQFAKVVRDARDDFGVDVTAATGYTRGMILNASNQLWPDQTYDSWNPVPAMQALGLNPATDVVMGQHGYPESAELSGELFSDMFPPIFDLYRSWGIQRLAVAEYAVQMRHDAAWLAGPAWMDDMDQVCRQYGLEFCLYFYSHGNEQTAGPDGHWIPGAPYNNGVRALNNSRKLKFAQIMAASDGSSQPPDPPDPPTTTMMMGVSASPNDHGGTEVWDGWRVYTRSEMLARANRTGSQRPKFLAYSADGTPLGSAGNAGVSTLTYNAIFNYVKGELDNFYYTGGASSQTHSARWGIQLFWSNGNENSNKGILATHTAQAISDYTNLSQKALYDAVHFIDPTTSQRRFPDAFAGSNPTQDHEFNGEVEAWLHPSARYHDFVMWSMYPPGRGVNDPTTADDPRFDRPSFNEADRVNRQRGFLIRCFYRTYQAQQAARAATGDQNFSLVIGCGEVGIGQDPGHENHRPHYTCHSLAGGMHKLAEQYSLEMPFACWWDNETSATAPHNILSDEPTGTSPSTREAWQDWIALNHEFNGGTHTNPNWPLTPDEPVHPTWHEYTENGVLQVDNVWTT